MADFQPQIGDNNQIQPDGTNDNQMNNSFLKHNAVQHIQELMFQDKTTVLVEVVNLTAKDVKQQHEIQILRKSLKKVMEDKEILQLNLMDEQQFQKAVGVKENQRQSLANKLNCEYNMIDGKIKSMEKMRSQLKIDVGNNRLLVDSLSKRMLAFEEKANKQTKEYSANVERWNTCKTEFKEKVDELQKQNGALIAARDEVATACDKVVKERETEITKLSTELTEMKEEQQQERRSMAEQKEALLKLQSEKDQLSQQYAELLQSSEETMSTVREEFIKREEETKKRHDEQLHACDVDKRELEEKVQNLEKEKRSLEEQTTGLQDTITKMRDELKMSNDLVKELEAQTKVAAQKEGCKRGPMETLNPYFNSVNRRQPKYFFHKPGSSKLQTSVSRVYSFSKPQNNIDSVPSNKINFMESYHYDNEMSLLHSSVQSTSGTP